MVMAVRQRKLLFVIFVLLILSLVTSLVLYALRQNISLFYTPTQVARGEAPKDQVIRVGGLVEKNSLVYTKGNLAIQFRLTDNNKTLIVNYHGLLPDLFREGQGIVAKGKLINEKVFIADIVLAKHDENYMPPELKNVIH